MSFTTLIAAIWFGAAVIFAIIEALTVGLTSIWFGGGALLAGIVALFCDNILIQIAVFLTVSIVLVILTRPLAKKHINDKAERTNVEAIVGMKGVVISAIVPPLSGQVKADGKVWTAVADHEIEVGKEVTVLEIKGVTLKVM